MNFAELSRLAKRYTTAWCSQNPERVAAFYSAGGSLRVNDGPAAVGRRAIAEVAKGFMQAFPDLVVAMDKVAQKEQGAEFHWTLTGTNTGPGGKGKRVCISGYEEWQLDRDGLIVNSLGHFDSVEYAHQLQDGAEGDALRCRRDR